MDDDLPPDPEVKPFQTCQRIVDPKEKRKCGCPMNPITVYRGHGSPSKKHLRGSLSQTCSNFSCLWTWHHTPAYNFEDAERLVRRIQFPGHASGLPRTLRPANDLPAPTQPIIPAPPQPAFNVAPHAPVPHLQGLTQPVATQAPIFPPSQSMNPGRIDCARPDCYTQSRSRTQGSRACTELLCRQCCVKTAKLALQNGFARKACHTHSQPEITGMTTAMATTVLQPPGMSPHAALMPSAPPQVNLVPGVSTQSIAPPSSQATKTQATKTATVSAVSGGVGRRLAQPVGGTWAHKRINPTAGESENIKTLKVQQYEMEEQRKRTVTLVVYHTEGEQPIRIDHYVQSFPHFRLSSSLQLMKDLELDATSRLDVWIGEWLTVSVDSVITIERDQRLLLKIRPSLRKGLENCPGIESELKLQPSANANRSLKRQGTDLVSPIRKSVKTTQELNTPDHHDLNQTHVLLEPRVPAPTPQIPPQTVNIPIPAIHPHIPGNDLSLEPQVEKADETHTRSKTIQKRWPFDFKVYQIRNGLIQIRETLNKARISSTRTRKHSSRKGTDKERPKYTITVEDAFRAAFPGAIYKKATFYEHREMWEKYDTEIVDLFVDLGDSKNATYQKLLKALKNPIHIPNEDSDSDPDPSDTETNDFEEARSVHSKSRSASILSEVPHTDPPNNPTPISKTNFPSTRSSQTSSIIFQKPNLRRLREQVHEMKELLEFMLSDPEESQFFCTARDTYRASSSQVRLANKSQDLLYCNSFYGSAGHSIIFAELENMFPKDSFDMAILEPLTRYVVMTEFLIPETVVLLVQDELRIPADEVLQVLRDQYIYQSNTQLCNDKPTHHTPNHPTSDLSPKNAIKKEPTECSLPQQGTTTPEVIDLTMDSSSESDDFYV